MKSLEALLEWGGIKREIACLIVSGIALLASMIGLPGLPFDPAWAAIILCGIPIILEAVIGLVTAFDIKADVLVSLALIASVLIGEDFAAGEVAFIMQLGALLEDLTVAKAWAGIEKLVRLTPRTARRITPDGEETIPAQQVQVGDLLRVLPGESIPVDGMILSGSTSIDQSVMTGESLPVDKTAGDTVSSGTINRFGAFEMKALRVGEDSAIQRMIRLVQSADAGKAKIVGMADRWATWIVITALTAAALTWLATGEIIRAVTILVVFCPCALVLATPTAIMAAIGNATRHGFLVREGDALERLAGVSHVAFDKTGTLTCGTLQVSHIISFLPHCSQERLFALAAAVELRSEHPLGKAVVASYRQRTSQELSQPQQFQMIPGQGVSAAVEGHQVAAGNEALLTALDVPLSPQACQTAEQWRKEGCMIIYLALDGVATPTAIMAAIGNATRHGFLVREGDALERLAGVSHVAFDKTGTLTCGTLQVSHIISFLPHCSQERLFALAAAVELRSEHPLGKAVVASYRQRTSQELSQPQQFQMIPGQGVSAAVEGHQVAAGNEALLTALDVPLSPQACQTAEQWRKEGCMIIYLALDGELAGALALSDTLRPNAAETIAQIHAAGVVPVLLTGDHEEAAVTIGTQVGLAEIHANCLPEDKLLEIQRLQSTGQMVCMIGDGINDAPALKKAHVGIAMGGVGSDIAVDAADIALVSDDIRQLPHLLRLSHRMMGTIRLNLTFSMALNFAAILLAMTGWLNPVVGALVHNAGSVLVILNSAFLLRWQRKTLC